MNFVTLMPQQIHALRCMIQIFRIQATRFALLNFKADQMDENKACIFILERVMTLSDLDNGLTGCEAEARTRGKMGFTLTLNPKTAQEIDVLLSYEYERVQLPPGPGNDEALAKLVSIILSEREGIKLAMATSKQDLPGVTQMPPAFKQ